MAQDNIKLDILAFGAHPDDVEIGAAGVLIKHVQRGDRVAICDLTLAELSSNGTVERRQQEAQEANRIMGIHARFNLKLPDRGIAISDKQIAPVVSLIRQHQPRIVLAPYWKDRHPDHEWTSRLVREAVFNAKIRRYHSELGDAHQVDYVYYYFINQFESPDLAVDVTDCYELKQHALMAYESQFIMENESVITPLNQDYVQRVAARDQLIGQQIGVRYAEGFKVREPVQKDYLD
ncbi:MAG: bacillithiol biosynthesis deacetylase BshB1 [Bacillaceae bacterium]|nr:bacillithiol biosynthesis deacetylase BshB1 [Bacillaceae bacterium]